MKPLDSKVRLVEAEIEVEVEVNWQGLVVVVTVLGFFLSSLGLSLLFLIWIRGKRKKQK